MKQMKIELFKLRLRLTYLRLHLTYLRLHLTYLRLQIWRLEKSERFWAETESWASRMQERFGDGR